MKTRGSLIPTSIVDKNGRSTTVYRKRGNGTRALSPTVTSAFKNGFSDEDAVAVTHSLTARVMRPENISWENIREELHYIVEWEPEWTDAEKRNLLAITDLCDVFDTPVFTAEVEELAVEIIDMLEPAVVPQMIGYNSSHPHADNWRARDKMLHDLASHLLIRRKGDDITYEPVEELITNPRIFGLEDAQNIALERFNHYEDNADGSTCLGDVTPYIQESIARTVRGYNRPSWFITSSSSDLGLLPKSERLVVAFSENEQGHILERQLYLALVFPVHELKDEMDRVDIDNVSISSFYNHREWGNVYTVLTPDGSTRSFSVYEHRNYDSIIINGLSDWNGVGHPYANENKNQHFGEFAPNEHKRAAQALTFYMMQAQQGELRDDDTLVRNAPHRDWNAILDATLPGFKQWRQSQISDNYISPDDENDDDLLNRLDF